MSPVSTCRGVKSTLRSSVQDVGQQHTAGRSDELQRISSSASSGSRRTDEPDQGTVHLHSALRKRAARTGI